jgi:hypothetical protein
MTIEQVTKLQELLKETSNYCGDGFNNLSLCGKVLTAIAWDNYPDKSYCNFLAALPEEVSSEIDKRGIFYRILGAQDKTSASCFEAGFGYVDTEEWYKDIPQRIVKEWKSDDESWEKITSAIEVFADEVIDEVWQYLKDLGLEQSDLKQLDEVEMAEN